MLLVGGWRVLVQDGAGISVSIARLCWGCEEWVVHQSSNASYPSKDPCQMSDPNLSPGHSQRWHVAVAVDIWYVTFPHGTVICPKTQARSLSSYVLYLTWHKSKGVVEDPTLNKLSPFPALTKKARATAGPCVLLWAAGEHTSVSLGWLSGYRPTSRCWCLIAA